MKIFIVGMHRSGTSLVTGLLHKCGLYLGNNLLMGARDNPKGHFEDREFIRINNQILFSNFGDWKRPPDRLVYKQHIIDRAKSFLSGFPEDGVCGFKDPRLCLTFPFWHHIIDPEPVKVVYVHRPVSEIAASLKKRNNIPLDKGKKLAETYISRAEKAIKNTGVWTTDVYFHDFFKPGWKVKLCYLCSILDLEFPKNPNKIESFIDERLWHHRKGQSNA